MRNNPESARHTYRAVAAWNADGMSGEKSMATLAASADGALTQFHRLLQTTKDSDHEHRVSRPKLKHDQYRITELFVLYYDQMGDLRQTPNAKMHRHNFDLPQSSNPDLSAPREKITDATTLMPFMEAVK